MSMWDEYCLVCGGPPYVFFDEVIDTDGEEANKTEKDLPQPTVAADFKWLEEFVGISHTEDVIPLSSYNGYGAFNINTNIHDTDEKRNKIFTIGCGNDDNRNNNNGIDEFGVTKPELHGYACHMKCFTLLQKELAYTLRYGDVRPLLEDSTFRALNKFAWSDYGGFSEYQDHSFGRETQLVEDGKLWMLEDPTAIGSANAQRILALWRPLVHNGFQRPGHAIGPNQFGSENVIGAANADAMDVKTTPKSDIHYESVGAASADEMRNIKVIPIPQHDIQLERARPEVNADADLHCKRIGATNADDVDRSDCRTLEFGECSPELTMNPL